jgi:glycosyltransferase involved in cell wall biosynthesis
MTDWDSPLHLCHVIDTLSIGGAENLLLGMIKRSPSSLRHSVCYRKGDGELTSDLNAAGGDVIDLDFSIQYDPFGVARLISHVRHTSVDVIHAHLPASMVAARLAGLISHTPVVSTQHNRPQNYQSVSRTLERLTRPIDAKTVAVSEGVRTAFGAASDPAWETIHNGIDGREFQSSVRNSDSAPVRDRWSIGDSLTYLSVGRCVTQKSPVDLVRAMEHVVGERPDATLVVVGSGPLLDDVKAAVSAHRLEESVIVTGHVDRVEPFFDLAHVFVSASRVEGLPLSILEAMAAGLPVVATAIPGIEECVDHGRTGLLVPPGDPELLGHEMARLGDERRRGDFGEAGLERVLEQFNIDSMVGEYNTLYKDVR